MRRWLRRGRYKSQAWRAFLKRQSYADGPRCSRLIRSRGGSAHSSEDRCQARSWLPFTPRTVTVTLRSGRRSPAYGAFLRCAMPHLRGRLLAACSSGSIAEMQAGKTPIGQRKAGFERLSTCGPFGRSESLRSSTSRVHNVSPKNAELDIFPHHMPGAGHESSLTGKMRPASTYGVRKRISL
jgi:hypothetical protein